MYHLSFESLKCLKRNMNRNSINKDILKKSWKLWLTVSEDKTTFLDLQNTLTYVICLFIPFLVV